MKTITRISICSAAAWLMWASFTAAQEDPTQAGEVSAALGVPPEQLSQCLTNIGPAVQPERPSAQRIQANKRSLLACLRKANPELTAEQVDEAMRGRRPGGRT